MQQASGRDGRLIFDMVEGHCLILAYGGAPSAANRLRLS